MEPRQAGRGEDGLFEFLGKMTRWSRRYYPFMLASLSLTFVYLYNSAANSRQSLNDISSPNDNYNYTNIVKGLEYKEFRPGKLLTRSEYKVKDNSAINPLSQLLLMQDFVFLKNCSTLCHSSNNINLLTFVHTSTDNFDKRRVIRKTWAAQYVQRLLGVKVIFLVGLPNNTETQHRLDAESNQYGDLVQGNFIDAYKNLTYKHLMGYKWVLTFCRQTKFIMKIDDDAYVNIFRIVSLLNETFSESSDASGRPKGILSCSLFPEGSPVKRQGKWSLTENEYPFDSFPAYCSGIGYFVTSDVAQDLYQASKYVKPFLWIDDLFITGILVAHFPIRHQPINFKFTYDPNDLRKWLKSSTKKPSSYIIGDIGDVSDWEPFMLKLWEKTSSYFIP